MAHEVDYLIVGAGKDLDRLERVFQKQKVVHKRLGLDYAFHSSAIIALR